MRLRHHHGQTIIDRPTKTKWNRLSQLHCGLCLQRRLAVRFFRTSGNATHSRIGSRFQMAVSMAAQPKILAWKIINRAQRRQVRALACSRISCASVERAIWNATMSASKTVRLMLLNHVVSFFFLQTPNDLKFEFVFHSSGKLRTGGIPFSFESSVPAPANKMPWAIGYNIAMVWDLN